MDFRISGEYPLLAIGITHPPPNPNSCNWNFKELFIIIAPPKVQFFHVHANCRGQSFITGTLFMNTLMYALRSYAYQWMQPT